MLSREVTHTNYIVFGLYRTELEPIIYRTRHYTTDAVKLLKESVRDVKEFHLYQQNGHRPLTSIHRTRTKDHDTSRWQTRLV